MPTVAISVDLLSKMHAAIGAAKAYRSTEKEVAGYQNDDAEIHAYEEREQLDLALTEYDRAGAESDEASIGKRSSKTASGAALLIDIRPAVGGGWWPSACDCIGDSVRRTPYRVNKLGVSAFLDLCGEVFNVDIGSADWKQEPSVAFEEPCFGASKPSRARLDDRVYFIQSERGGPVKIGYAHNPISRLAELQRYSPFRLHILETVPGSLELEQRLHKRFAAAHSHGEWFHPGECLLAFIRSLGRQS